MPVQKLYFFAPVANVDASILKIKLNVGFEFASMTKMDGISFIANLEKIPLKNFYNYWRFGHTVLQSERLYLIKKSFEFDLPINEAGKPETNHNFYLFIYDFVEKNVEESLRLLRLFKEGNVHIPYWIVYYFDKDEPIVLFARGLSSSQSQNIYHLDDMEIQSAQNFIEITLIPKPPNYITLAHENYEVSYFIDNDSHAFLSLMISLEVLFKPKQYRNFSRILSDEVGILLGNSNYEIQNIRNEITRLYDKRSELVHEGKPVFHYAGETDDVKILRHYIRESLKKIIRLDLSKDDLLEYLGKMNVCKESE
ncbi:HEPN domain-containing protein [Methanoregula sp.]|uniref:HEPN domain-containing protein n=1 Tax=Methanoregula sp. TaxID=2052170 RepID=UPI002374D98A|nr:HEPN domain-containing protein [Methanoregula sp.]MDD1686346.1 hypothetical protein [Methanoregula sp.]